MATRLDAKPQQSISTPSILSKLRQLKSEIKDQHSLQHPSSSTPPPSQLPRIRDLPAWNQFRSEIEQQIEIQAKTLEQEQKEKEKDSQQSTSSSVSTQNHTQIQPQNEDEGEIGYKQKIQDRLDRSKKLGPNYVSRRCLAIVKEVNRMSQLRLSSQEQPYLLLSKELAHRCIF